MNNDVKNWMKTEFPQSLALLKAQAGDPLETERIQNSLLQRALDNVYTLLAEQTLQIKVLSQKLDRRTAVLSPTKSFSTDTYQHSYDISKRKSSSCLRHFVFQFPIAESLSSFPSRQPTFTIDNPPTTPTRSNTSEDTGIYISEDDGLPRAFVNGSPKVSSTPRAKTQVDLVLPDPIAFTKSGELVYTETLS